MIPGSNALKPLVLFDPFPPTAAMEFTPDLHQALGEIARVEAHFGSRAPDPLVERLLPEVEAIVGQTSMDRARMSGSSALAIQAARWYRCWHRSSSRHVAQ